MNNKNKNYQMQHHNRVSTYNKFPTVKIDGFNNDAKSGYANIAQEILKHTLNQSINMNDQAIKQAKVIVIDCYMGMNDAEVLGNLEKSLKPSCIIHAEDLFFDGATLDKMQQAHITQDRVRGVMYYGKLQDFIDPMAMLALSQKLAQAQQQKGGLILIYGVGASLLTEGDVLIYADLARWEIQMRYRAGMPNFKQDNQSQEFLQKYKRGFFIEWRICDKHKRNLFEKADFWLDTNLPNHPKMISGAALRAGLKQTVTQPFRIVPYFDPGVWGGQWMKEVCDLDRNQANFAWSFDGVPEENSLLLQYDTTIIEIPSLNVVLYQAQALLGEHVYARFGAEFPIRFDFLDTVDGQNLSLQVHPTADFIREEYGMPYTQEESYYVLDAKEDAHAYLGFKNEVNRTEMEADLASAQAGKISFPAEKYVNIIPIKAHDHLLIPPGAIHCSGSGAMILEISASAYIFTFKLWDWDRVGLDGIPRPIHLEEGKKNLNYAYNTDFTMNELVNQFEVLAQESNYLEEKTGLHSSEFIETRRYTLDCAHTYATNGTVHMLNLVGGEEITITSPSAAFKPFIVHYVETFIIPAAIDYYVMTPTGNSLNKKVKVLAAFVR